MSKMTKEQIESAVTQAMNDCENLRKLGWTKQDFAAALKALIPFTDKPNRVFIVVEGGNVQDVFADDDTLTAYLIDYDNGDSDASTKAHNIQMEEVCDELTSLQIHGKL